MQWQFDSICPCAASERLPRLMRRKVAMLRAFFVHFKNVYKSCLLLFVALPGLIDIFLNSCQLEDSCYDCLWRGDKGIWYRKIFSAYHGWPELWHYIYCFLQSGEAFTVKGNKHTRAGARKKELIAPFSEHSKGKSWKHLKHHFSVSCFQIWSKKKKVFYPA